jgi:hypothetical protein
MWSVHEFTNVDTGTPFGTPALTETDSGVTSATTTIGETPDAGDWVLAVFGAENSSAGLSANGELDNVPTNLGGGTDVRTIFVGYDTSPDSSPAPGVTTASSQTIGGIGVIINKVAGGGGGGGATITDNFERASANTLGANWTDEAGGFEIINNADARGESQSFAKNLAVHVTPTTTADQYVRIRVAITGSAFPGVVFRYSDTSSGHYVCDWDVDSFWWSFYENITDAATDPGSRNIIDNQTISFSSGNAVGITCIGTGASTTLRVWFNTTATAPDAGGTTWDSAAPDINQLIDAGTAADTGLEVGIVMFWNSPSGTSEIQEFSAGDVP